MYISTCNKAIFECFIKHHDIIYQKGPEKHGTVKSSILGNLPARKNSDCGLEATIDSNLL